jgi:sulfite oxidase
MTRKKTSRRSFITKSALASFSAMIGSKIVFGENLPEGLTPVGITETTDPKFVPGKSTKLKVLTDQPWEAETPAHLLDPETTPADLMFVRNNGLAPTEFDLETWTLTIDGESVDQAKTFTLKELYNSFDHYSYNLVLECAGNGRSEFNPPAKGAQWATGAVGCCKWTGVRLKDVLNSVGVKEDAIYIGYYGADLHLSKDPAQPVISRGVPIKKAMEDETLLAWAMNDKAIPVMNGYPLRLVCGGWPASVSGKWLTRISVRNIVHDGEKMMGQSYRVPKYPIEPGSEIPDADFEIIGSMPVKSLITYPKSGAIIPPGNTLEIRGHAWAGDLSVSAVHVSVDFGMTWKKCLLKDPVNRLAWQRWGTVIELPEKGYYEIWAKATDANGKSQPMVVPGWNPKGYLNNATHRIAVKQG